VAWLIHNWFWLLLALILVVLSVVVTRNVETRRYRVRLILSLLILEGWFYLATKATSLMELLLLGVLGVALMRVCMPALSHILAQKMADKATDAMFGEREPAPPTLERQTVNQLRRKRRPAEAISHLKAVLEKNPDDFESRFLLASIHVEDLRDLASAEREIKIIQDAKTISPALQALAGQRLKLWQDVFRMSAATSSAADRPESPSLQPVTAEPEPIIIAEGTSVPAVAPVYSHQTVGDLCRAGHYGSAILMVDQMIEEKPGDLKAWAMKARIHVQFLQQPSMADRAMRRILAAEDFSAEQAEAVNELAEAYAKTKEDAMKAGRLWRLMLDMPSVSPEQKTAVQIRLQQWHESNDR
jgi:tetratricopeptide (TPR) repeat protein